MNDHAFVTCTACDQSFRAALPLTRRGMAASTLMFLVEVCPHCTAASSYLRSDYRYAIGA